MPHIVKEFAIGHTRVRIADDYCRDKTAEDIERILKDIAKRVQFCLVTAETQSKGDDAL